MKTAELMSHWWIVSMWVAVLAGCSGDDRDLGRDRVPDAGSPDASDGEDAGTDPVSSAYPIDVTGGVAEILPIEDFDDGDVLNLVGAGWGVFDDSSDNGTSEAWPPSTQKAGADAFVSDSPGYGDTGYAAHLIGTTGSVLGYDYLGVATGLHPDSGCPLATPTEIDMGYYDGVQFLVKGTFAGGALDLIIGYTKDGPEDNCSREGFPIPDSLTGFADYHLDFADQVADSWSLVRIRFKDMTQPAWGSIEVEMEEVLAHAKALTWQYQQPGGEVDLWLDNIALFKDFPSTEVYPQTVVTSESALEIEDEATDPATAVMTDVPVSGQSFTSSKQIAVDLLPEKLWDITAAALTEAPVRKGDLLYADLWARCVTPPSGANQCRMNFNFTENGGEWTLSGFLPITVGGEWTRFSVPFKSAASYEPGGATAGFWLGYPAQTVAIAGLTVSNYGDTITPDTLPRTEISYEGRAADASWRVAAAERIETYRKGDLSIVVQDRSGAPVSNAAVSVTMSRHAFGFGTAISSDALRYDFSESDRSQYEAAVSDLFNMVVLEDTLKWPALDGLWGDEMGLELAHWAVDWADARSLPVRGHVLVWPGWDNLPSAIKVDYITAVANDGRDAGNVWLEQTVASHVTDTATAMAGRLAHWDVLNEPYMNHDLMDLLGPEVMTDWFRLARKADPDAKLFINEYGIVAPVMTYSGMLENLMEVLTVLVDQGAPVDGIGLQGHYYYELMDPETVYDQLERLAAFDKEIWISEFDIRELQDEYPELTADFTRDLLTIFFSHPNAGGFMMWGFWDGSHAGGPAPLYDRNWNEKPSCAVYRDLVYRQWWTDESGVTDTEGRYVTRGFLGDYQITVTGNGSTTTRDFALSPESGEIVISLE